MHYIYEQIQNMFSKRQFTHSWLGHINKHWRGSCPFIHNLKMEKDVIVICYNYLIGKLSSRQNSLFMYPTCLNPWALISEIGTFMILPSHALFLHLETMPSYLQTEFPFLTLGIYSLLHFQLTFLFPFWKQCPPEFQKFPAFHDQNIFCTCMFYACLFGWLVM